MYTTTTTPLKKKSSTLSQSQGITIQIGTEYPGYAILKDDPAIDQAICHFLEEYTEAYSDRLLVEQLSTHTGVQSLLSDIHHRIQKKKGK